jgi:predicted Zn finger-like uncharacterized protein
MQLACPSCQTSFNVKPEALGAEGRNVRCAVCKNVWFASPADVEAPALELAMAGDIPPEPPAPEPIAPITGLIPDQEKIEWSEAATYDVTDAPPIVPAMPPVPRNTASRAPAKKVLQKSMTGVRKSGRSKLLTLTAVLAAVLTVAIGSRTTIVRTVPDLASLYAAIGLPVNLRGLEFYAVNTGSEVQDGITVLVIEGEVVNVTRQPVELPRLRLAILDQSQRELYSWTSMLPRSILADGERIAFRSRLASPPADGREVLVRFLSRSDLTSTR